MQRHFEEELEKLKEKLVLMGELVEGMIARATLAVSQQDPSAKESLIRQEERVNLIQIEIDELGISLIALQQPAATDLRFITAAMKINNDLERMADQAVNISQHIVRPSEGFSPEIFNLLNMISQKAQAMVKDCLTAFLKKDLELAQSVLKRDDEVDDLKDNICLWLTSYMKKNPEKIASSIDLLLVSRNLERIADHATNIAEDVIYIVAGKDIRHHILDK